MIVGATNPCAYPIRRLLGCVLTAARHREILRLLAERGGIPLKEIEARFRVSAATARRDADRLADSALAKRTRGGLLPVSFALGEAAFPRKLGTATSVKAKLAHVVAKIVPEDGTVFVDSGTTCLEVGRCLLDRDRTRIFTNSVPLLALASGCLAQVSAIGGEVRKISLALTGAVAQSWLSALRFDVAVIGASGADSVLGASTTELAEAEIKTMALKAAQVRILVIHADKWNKPSTVRFAPWESFTHIVTDRAFTRAERLAVGSRGVKIVGLPSP
jgi:DeoR/GlpR family transcriptional regulator of sugar metabolism